MTTLQEKNHFQEFVQEVPSNQSQPLTSELNPLLENLEDRELKTYKIGAIIIYILAYIYISSFADFKPVYFFPLALGLISLTEVLSRRRTRALAIKQNKLETAVFLCLTLGQALALSIWDFRLQLEIFQFLALHTSFIFYVASRNGWLVQGRLGVMVWFDAINSSIILPFRHFLLTLHVMKQPLKTSQQSVKPQPSAKVNQLVFVLVSIFVAIFLVTFTWSQLSQVSEKFAIITENFSRDLFQLMASLFGYSTPYLFVAKLTVALPIALWLYGLILGSLLDKKDFALTYNSFHHKTRGLRVFPQLTAYIIIGSLCLIYGLFFAIAVSELSSLLALDQTVSPQNASTVAVSGFWQLVRVSLLNFLVLGAFYLLADKPLWDRKGTRLALTLLFVFASLFALLAGWKLFGIYIFLYGPTPLRLLSGWFILVLLVWCLLTLVRLYRPIQAVRLGTLYAFISFTLLCYLHGLLIY